MIKVMLIVFSSIFLVGCIAHETKVQPADTFKGYHLFNDPKLPLNESKAITTAKTHLEKPRYKEWEDKTVDAYYRVTNIDDEYQVIVRRVEEYDADGQPMFIRGCMVVISKDWQVVRVVTRP